MAARSKYPPPHVQLRRLAERARAEGVAFEEFWERAVRPGQPPVTYYKAEGDRPADAVVWSTDTTDRNLARAAVEESREGWRRAYEGEPASRPEQALIVLSPLLAMIEGARGIEGESAVPSAA